MRIPTSRSCNDADKTEGFGARPELYLTMPEVGRDEVILRFLAAYDIPLRHKEIYGGLIEHYEITFSYKQTRDSVTKLYEDGLLRRVEIDADDGTVRDIPDDATNRRGYYLISDRGRKQAESTSG